MALEISKLLTPEQVQRLRAKSNVIGALLVLHAWALIFGSMALFAWWPNPFTFLLAAMVIGARQLGIAILMHDAAHGLLFSNRRANEWVATWLCAAPVFTSLQLYRPYHLTHHRHTQQAEDPDLGLSAPFPITRRSLWRKVARDLTGRTAYQRRLAQFRRGLTGEWKSFVANLVLLLGLAAVGYWWLYPLLWLMPLATWYQLVSRIRNIAEHAVVPDDDDPLRNTRTTLANFFERLFVAPYWVNYHLEHHLFLFVPCWRLPKAHRALIAAGLRERMEIQPGYAAVLRLATSRQDEDASRRGPRGAQRI
ncbi:MAG: fatty acid desaturase family protein [Reyranella sp.]|uniref:fatty acid desaturase family protein n=1 Tax=Reyranella sp. TaxID=1929291 RepID=UPI001AD570BD|nr:fatty acid desaturase family protein [Reyranella sp.]MBN9089657.1 fatty acid desaturase family protein [Reyranella sp.]